MTEKTQAKRNEFDAMITMLEQTASTPQHLSAVERVARRLRKRLKPSSAPRTTFSQPLCPKGHGRMRCRRTKQTETETVRFFYCTVCGKSKKQLYPKK